MSNQITKFQLEEKIRRLYFKHRGNLNAIIEETGLDEEYIRKVTNRIRKKFKHDVSFEIACFVTEALLSGREQRLVILEDRLREILQKKSVVSLCCGYPIAIHEYGGSTWFRCKKCQQNCETTETDQVNDNTLIKFIDRMRKEDELIGKFLATMGIIAKNPDLPIEEGRKNLPENPTIDIEVEEELPPAEQKLIQKLKLLDPSDINRIRRLVESEVNRVTNDPQES